MHADRDDDIYLSVAISAYNEEMRIGHSLRKIVAYLDAQDYGWELVVNDDGSSDRTPEVVRSVDNGRITLLTSPINLGKGGGIRRAILASRGKHVLFTDADLSTPIEEVDKLLARLRDDFDLAVGSRLQPDGSDMRVTQPVYRRVFGRFFHTLTWLLVVRGIGDTQSGFKCFRREVAHDLFASSVLNSIIFDVEVLYLAQRRGYRIAEVPVSWTNAGGSRMRVTGKHAVTVLWDLLRIPLIHRGVGRRVLKSKDKPRPEIQQE
ncbi:MAG: glycosyltransferase family 2 protein [Chloroflexi bacterium]|nr:glycosyltransferase family 2 protein [Chloroflexota bacterium]